MYGDPWLACVGKRQEGPNESGTVTEYGIVPPPHRHFHPLRLISMVVSLDVPLSFPSSTWRSFSTDPYPWKKAKLSPLLSHGQTPRRASQSGFVRIVAEIENCEIGVGCCRTVIIDRVLYRGVLQKSLRIRNASPSAVNATASTITDSSDKEGVSKTSRTNLPRRCAPKKRDTGRIPYDCIGNVPLSTRGIYHTSEQHHIGSARDNNPIAPSGRLSRHSR